MSANRSFVLAAVGAVAGLTLAGYALFTAKGTSTLIVPADAVATVNDQPVARSDYLAALQALYTVTPAEASALQRHRVLDDLIREELFVQRARELDVAAFDPEVRAAMIRSVEDGVAADAITHVTTDAELRAYYEAKRDRYSSEGTMTLRDLVFPPDRAAAAAEALGRGGDADEVLVRSAGRDTQLVKGEEFYFAARIHLGEQMFLAARNLADGGVAGPLIAAGATHVLLMIKNHVPRPFSFDEARARLQSDFTQDAIKRSLAKQEDFLRKRANVRIAKDMD